MVSVWWGLRYFQGDSVNYFVDVESLRPVLSGAVLARGDAGYDEARSAWNGQIDRYPALIARCSDAADVTTAIGFARRHDLEAATTPRVSRSARAV